MDQPERLHTHPARETAETGAGETGKKEAGDRQRHKSPLKVSRGARRTQASDITFLCLGTKNRRQKCQGEAGECDLRLGTLGSQPEGGGEGEAAERPEVAITQEEFVPGEVTLPDREQPVQPRGQEEKQELGQELRERKPGPGRGRLPLISDRSLREPKKAEDSQTETGLGGASQTK